jgi:sugar phosphate isomerase/epimerase
MDYSRRDLGKLALGAVPGVMLAGSAPLQAVAAAQGAKPNSLFGGVQIGIIAPYAFQGAASTLEQVLARTIEVGLSAVELRGDLVEIFAGLPPDPAAPATPAPSGAAAAGRGAAAAASAPPATPGSGAAGRGGGAAASPAAAPTAAELAALKTRAAAVRKWRISQNFDKYREARQMYERAGVAIQIARFPLNDSWTDDEIDYAFNAAKALGARAIHCEPPLSQTKRLGLFADKHKMMLGYHNHANVTSVEAFARPGSWEQAFFYSPFNGANLDIGHFVAGNSRSPIPFIQEYHQRITGIHLKDRRMNAGPNVPWGQGDTPIREVLQLMKREKYPFMAIIELEYRVEGSDSLAEIRKCVDFCREALA